MKWLLLASLFLSSCTVRYWEPTLTNTVSFDSSFTPHQKLVIQEGLDVWTNDTGGRVTFTEVQSGAGIQIISGSEQQAQQVDNQNDSTLPPAAQADTIGLSIPIEGKLYLYLDRLSTDEQLLQVAAHEAGHQIGMIHVPQYQEALMDPDLNEDLLGQTHLTQYDILQFCDYWGCQGENPALPANN